MTRLERTVLTQSMKTTEVNKLKNWFLKHQRDLPWRKDQSPYKVWISETMLQQTTSQAVVGYYQKFLKRFPTLKSLASSSLDDVYEMWAGLGYYSRARNLHKAAQKLVQNGGFQKNTTHKQLLTYPGFGPYTARAVASIAFGESVGVLDGNVIRVLSRYSNYQRDWWKTSGRQDLQSISDKAVQGQCSRTINQAMMELGATICTPKNPKCLICPITKYCQAFKLQIQDQLPVKKPKVAHKIIFLKIHLYKNKQQLALKKNTSTPFLKGQWLPPHESIELHEKPTDFDFQHSITNYKIFVKIQKLKTQPQSSELFDLKTLKKITPSSLVDKILKFDNLSKP